MDWSLVVDWLGREGGDVLSWWLLVTLAGVAVWPLVYRVLGGLPDRGYTLARAAGVMLTGFVFWFLASLGLLHNTPGGMVFAWIAVLALGLVAFFRWDDRPPVRAWARENLWLIVVTEALFLLLLFGWAAYRAHNPEMQSTEKPMEIMFLNGIRSSEVFPPRDPWLSGYAISYYYFGYVIAAMLADLSGVSNGVAFNITIAMTFALTGTGALGVVYNMVRSRGPAGRFRAGSVRAGLAAGALGLCFLALMGNLGTALVEFPYRGYTPGLVNAAYFDFWDVERRAGTVPVMGENGALIDVPVDTDGDSVPNWDDDRVPLDEWGFWDLGWRYSRVVHDRDLNGDPIGVQPITEVPSFSFVLSDIHPHVLALPFAVLALGLALNLVLGGRALARYEYPLYAIWVGGMVFMNSWDAIYLPLLVGAEALRRLVRRGTGTLSRDDLIGVVRFAAIVGGLTLVFYLPWLISFTSQAGGVLPNVIYPTQWQQFFLQFGTFLVILLVFLIVEMRCAGRSFHWQAGLLGLTFAACAAIVVTAALGVSVWGRDDVRGAVYAVVDGSGGLGEIVPDVLARRLSGLPSEIALLVMIYLVVGRLFARPAVRSVTEVDVDERELREDGVVWVRAITYSPATGFALLLAGAGAVLTFAPDFIYLRDNFAVRINTVFKLYYQGWLVFSLASAFAVWSVLVGGQPVASASRRGAVSPAPLPARVRAGRAAFGAAVAALFLAGMAYPVLAMQGRALVDTGRLRTQKQIAACDSTAGEICPEQQPLTLDGVPQMVNSEEYAAIQCLLDLGPERDAVLLEAPGGAYEPQRSRFSGLTGIPTLIGWQNHERQWRGESYPRVTDHRLENGQPRDRATDVGEIYTTQDWDRAWSLIDRYGINYIVVGYAERQMVNELAGGDEGLQREYAMGLEKFAQVLQPVCESGSVAVYRVAPN